MARQFEFRLIDGAAPEGELEADHLLAIVESLKEVAMKLGRTETAAETVGRPPKRTQRVAKLSIGLAAGSTRLLVRRSESGQEVLPFEVDEGRGFDEKFQEIIESIAADLRPEWVPDPLARAASNLRSAWKMPPPLLSSRPEMRSDASSTRMRHTRKHGSLERRRQPGTWSPSLVGFARSTSIPTGSQSPMTSETK